MQQHNTTLKNSLLLTAIATCAPLSTAMAAADATETPQRPAVDCVHSVEQTPGKKISRMISESLTREKFLQALSADEMRSIDINWVALSNPGFSFDHPDIRNSLVKLIRVLKRLLPEKSSDPSFMELWGQISIIDASITSVHWNRAKELIPQYFNSISCEVIDLAPKLAGVQFGAKATVRLQNGRIVKYHIKTHSGGLVSGKSSAAKLVNPAELLVYKVLEGLGVGSQSHFFGRDGQNLYIATLDAGVQLNPDGTFTQSPFKEYEHFKNAKDPAIQAQLWGALTQLPPDVEFSEEQHLQAEQWLNSDKRSWMFVHEMNKLDLLARMMWLTDFQTNPGNYGFIQGQEGKTLVKAIDFRLAEVNQIDQYKCSQGSFESFLSGNGLYHYSSADKVTCYALRHRQQHLRVQEANSIINLELRNFEETVNLAASYVLHSLDSVIMTDTERTRTKKELTQYSDIIKSNFRFFKEQLASLSLEDT